MGAQAALLRLRWVHRLHYYGLNVQNCVGVTAVVESGGVRTIMPDHVVPTATSRDTYPTMGYHIVTRGWRESTRDRLYADVMQVAYVCMYARGR